MKIKCQNWTKHRKWKLFNYMSEPQNSFWAPHCPKLAHQGPKKSKMTPKSSQHQISLGLLLRDFQLIMFGSMTKLQRLALGFIRIRNFFAHQRNTQISAIKIITKPKGFLLEYFRLVVLTPESPHNLFRSGIIDLSFESKNWHMLII